MKRLCILVTIFALLIGITTLSAAAGADLFIVTNIQNDKITIKDSKGQLKTLPAGSPGLKVGDRAKVVGNRVCSWDWGNKPAQGVKRPVTQKNLPFDDGSKAR